MALRAGAGQLWIGLLAALCVFFVLGVLAHYNAIGGGDVKLIAATCLLVPPDRIPLLLIEIALAGGVLSCLYLAGGLLLRRQPALYRRPAGTAKPGTFRKWLRREGSRIARGYPNALCARRAWRGYHSPHERASTMLFRNVRARCRGAPAYSQASAFPCFG